LGRDHRAGGNGLDARALLNWNCSGHRRLPTRRINNRAKGRMA
jgi:hypothetical protein